jgi:hypothetical protein
MKVIAQNQSHRLIHVVRGAVAPLVKEDWRLQVWNGEDWGGRTKMFYDKNEAINAARAVGLIINDEAG